MKRSPLIFGVVALSLVSTSSQAFTPQDQNALKEFLDGAPVTDLSAMVSADKLHGEVKESPWAGYYWPEGFGSIATPYRDPSFPHALISLWSSDSGFNRTHRWMKAKWGETLTPAASALSDQEVNNLGPSLKYDLLFSANDYTLTHTILDRITEKAKKYRIKAWEGICNGWTLATLAVDRPLHAIQVKSAQGRLITFYPHDLMALSALLYARSPINDWNWFLRDANYNRTPVLENGAATPGATFEPVWLRFIGRRCDGGNSGCGDLNAGVFHTAIVNSIGYHDSGFIMDKHKSPAIGNVAAYGYIAKLYNTESGQEQEFPKVLSTRLTDDEKSKGAVSKVGVLMTLKTRKELVPFELNDEKEAHYQDLEGSNDHHYDYVLLLDAQNQVIEGIWKMRLPLIGAENQLFPRYPDFLWKLPTHMLAFSGFEGSLNSADFNLANGVIDVWKKPAEDSSKLEQPMGTVLYPLISASRE